MISAPLIVKDESARIADCLRSIRGAVDEIIVLDTGSTDGTPDICRELADRVLFSAQFTAETPVEQFHFADARNEVLAACSGDWILSVDADETLHWSPTFRDWLDGKLATCWNVRMRFADRPQHVAQLPRLFRREGSRWVGRYHDVPMPWNEQAGSVPEGVLSLTNHGGHNKGKLLRNIALLKRQQFEEGRIGHTTFQIADTYRALGVGCYPEAIGYYEMCLSAMGRLPSASRPYILFALADCYARVGLMAKAIDVATQLTREYADYARGYLLLGMCHERLKQYDIAICYYQRAMAIDNPMPLHPAFDEPLDVDAITNQVMVCDTLLREAA